MEEVSTGGCGGACLPGWFSVCSGWFWCALGVFRALIGGIHSRWTQMFFSVVRVAIRGEPEGCRVNVEHLHCFNIFLLRFLLIFN